MGNSSSNHKSTYLKVRNAMHRYSQTTQSNISRVNDFSNEQICIALTYANTIHDEITVGEILNKHSLNLETYSQYNKEGFTIVDYFIFNNQQEYFKTAFDKYIYRYSVFPTFKYCCENNLIPYCLKIIEDKKKHIHINIQSYIELDCFKFDINDSDVINNNKFVDIYVQLMCACCSYFVFENKFSDPIQYYIEKKSDTFVLKLINCDYLWENAVDTHQIDHILVSAHKYNNFTIINYILNKLNNNYKFNIISSDILVYLYGLETQDLFDKYINIDDTKYNNKLELSLFLDKLIKKGEYILNDPICLLIHRFNLYEELLITSCENDHNNIVDYIMNKIDENFELVIIDTKCILTYLSLCADLSHFSKFLMILINHEQRIVDNPLKLSQHKKLQGNMDDFIKCLCQNSELSIKLILDDKVWNMMISDKSIENILSTCIDCKQENLISVIINKLPTYYKHEYTYAKILIYLSTCEDIELYRKYFNCVVYSYEQNMAENESDIQKSNDLTKVLFAYLIFLCKNKLVNYIDDIFDEICLKEDDLLEIYKRYCVFDVKKTFHKYYNFINKEFLLDKYGASMVDKL